MRFKKYWRKTSLKNQIDGNFLLNHIKQAKPKNFLEIGIFHGVTSRNVCEMLHLLHGSDFANVPSEMVIISSVLHFQIAVKIYPTCVKMIPWKFLCAILPTKYFCTGINLCKGDLRFWLSRYRLGTIYFLDGP